MLIVGFGMGVSGSAFGAELSQALAFAGILAFRLRGRTQLPLSVLVVTGCMEAGRIQALGAPQSRNFIGLALGSATNLTALQWVRVPGYGTTVSACGIITRVMIFAFLPLFELRHATQTITGKNDVVAFVYRLALQVLMACFASAIGQAFVRDPAVVAEVARILPVMTGLFFATGLLMMIAMHFQAIGDADRAALLDLSKPYLFAIPLTFAPAGVLGETGIWIAGPFAEAMLFVLTVIVLYRAAQANRPGLFPAVRGEQA